MEYNKIYCGDVLDMLRSFPSECVDMVMTSPPYWGLRDYGTARWEGGDAGCDHNPQRPDGGQRENRTLPLGRGGMYKEYCFKCGAFRIDNQIGLEPTPEEYVAKMVEVFREVKRVLKKHGTVWLNLGDSYAGGGGALGIPQDWDSISMNNRDKFPTDTDPKRNAKKLGLKPKDLVGIPWRVAFALQADGWYLRQDIIWAKPNPMPESVTDRCTKSHEYLFLLSKSKDYYYDNEAIKEESNYSNIPENRYVSHAINGSERPGSNRRLDTPNPSGRNKRSVWTINTIPFPEAHFATFPEELCEYPIKAGSSEKGVCRQCGEAWERMTEKVKCDVTNPRPFSKIGNEQDRNDVGNIFEEHSTMTIGWQPTCSCNQEPIPAIVMDIFSGAGTTSVVAKRLGRSYVGIELNSEYAKMSEQRLMLVGKESVMNLKQYRETIKTTKPLTDFMGGA